jgi:hypothetical protein
LSLISELIFEARGSSTEASESLKAKIEVVLAETQFSLVLTQSLPAQLQSLLALTRSPLAKIQSALVVSESLLAEIQFALAEIPPAEP